MLSQPAYLFLLLLSIGSMADTIPQDSTKFTNSLDAVRSSSNVPSREMVTMFTKTWLYTQVNDDYVKQFPVPMDTRLTYGGIVQGRYIGVLYKGKEYFVKENYVLFLK